MPSTFSLSYKPHKDYMDLDDEDEKQLGNRILTVFLYLSDVDEGGQTSFTALNLTVSPKLGRVLIWPNVLNDDPTEIELLTEHESLPVVKGTKYGANVWFRLKPSTTAYKDFTCDDGEEERETLEDMVDERREMENERTTHGFDQTVGSEL
jgi:2OG-Fe(II) oxygenase superfamily